VIIADGSQPIGDGIGPILEANDVMAVLGNDRAAPAMPGRETCSTAARR